MPGLENIWQGVPRMVEILTGSGTNTWRSPDKGKAWLILGGKINHVTGTLAAVTIVDRANNSQTLWVIKTLAAADISADYSLFETIMDVARTGDYQSAWHPFILFGDMALYLGGDAAENLYCQVLEFDYP